MMYRFSVVSGTNHTTSSHTIAIHRELSPVNLVIGGRFYIEGGRTLNYPDHKAVIYLHPEVAAELSQSVAAHELGHAIGLAHSEGGIMAPEINAPKEVTPEDAQNYLNLE